MLEIYIGDINKPKNIINDNEWQFKTGLLKKTDAVIAILSYVEKGSWCSIESFIDKYGYKLSVKYLSTSTKILINLVFEKSICINCSELGQTAFEYLLCGMDGIVWFKSCRNFIVPKEDNIILGNIRINNKEVTSYIQLEDLFYEEGI